MDCNWKKEKCANHTKRVDERKYFCYNFQKKKGNYTLEHRRNGSFGWSILGCCIPLVGLILFLVWNKEKPKTAKKAGIGALVGVIISVLFYVIIFVIGIGSASMGYYY